MKTTETETVDPRPEAPPSDITVWCVAAKLAASRPSAPEEQDAQSGTKHFKPGAKVYAIDWVPEVSGNLVVIGHHRKSRQFVKAVVSVAWLEELGLEQVAIPNVTTLARKHAISGGTPLTKEHAEAILKALVGQHTEL